jgi:hypothetical protein
LIRSIGVAVQAPFDVGLVVFCPVLCVPDILANICTFHLLITNLGKSPLELVQEYRAGSAKCSFFDEYSGPLDRPRQVPCLGPVRSGHAVEIPFTAVTFIRHLYFSTIIVVVAVDSTVRSPT